MTMNEKKEEVKVEDKDLDLVEKEKVLEILDTVEDTLFNLQAYCKGKRREIRGR